MPWAGRDEYGTITAKHPDVLGGGGSFDVQQMGARYNAGVKYIRFPVYVR